MILAALALTLFLYPGVSLVRDVCDPSFAAPGIPRRAITLHRDLTPRIEAWARERVASKRAASAPLHDVPTTEWPMFTAVFYLLGTEQLEDAWHRGELGDGPEPMRYARGAVDAARDLALDPSHHTWVRTHWGAGYMHREDVFFRALVIAALTSHQKLTGDASSEPLLRDQVETLASSLDAAPLGVLDDYPGECYPIDVLVAIAWIRRADAVLGTDHRAFVARSVRAFTAGRADALGLVPYRVDLPSGSEVQPARGVGMSWVLAFSPDLWPEVSRDWYARYERSFWEDHGWASGFREWASSPRGPVPSAAGAGAEAHNGFEIDAGYVVDGLGMAASAFGIAAARRNGRFDQAYTLESELAAASWTLPDGTLLAPRLVSHAADAPYLGEAAIQYFLTVQPAPGVAVVRGGHLSGLVYFGFAVYFGVPLAVLRLLGRRSRAKRGAQLGEALPA
jgi:hypothetical protein